MANMMQVEVCYVISARASRFALKHARPITPAQLDNYQAMMRDEKFLKRYVAVSFYIPTLAHCSRIFAPQVRGCPRQSGRG